MEPVAVVVPTLNEAAAIGGVVAELRGAGVQEVIVADSASRDGTPEIARAAGARVVGVGRTGYGSACAAGAAAASPECGIIAFIDGDGADRGDLIARLVEPIAAGTHDFVIASRTRGERAPGSMSWHQVLAGQLAGFGMGALYGVRYSDMCAFRAIRKDVLGRMQMKERTYGWNLEMQLKAVTMGLRILEVPVHYRCRIGGVSKVSGNLRASWQTVLKIIEVFHRVRREMRGAR